MHSVAAVYSPPRSVLLRKLLNNADLQASPRGWGACGQALIGSLARSKGFSWPEAPCIEGLRPQLERAAIKAVDPALVYPPYFLKSFHGTKNLTWDAAAHQAAGMKLFGGHDAALTAAVDLVQKLFPQVCADPRLIVDVGCGTGGSSRIWARRFPQALVQGVDLSPCMLAWASTMAAPEDENVQWVHANGEDLPCKMASVDIVAASFYAHEQPRAAMRQTVAQAFERLREGGVFVLLDNGQVYLAPWMKKLPDAAKYWGSNALLFEPFGPDFIDADFAAIVKDAGFVSIHIDCSDPARLLIAAQKP